MLGGQIHTVIRRYVMRVGRSSLARSSLALMSGSVASQLIFLLSAPILTRIFGFTEFGVLANYNAWVAFLALLGSLRYEHAIIVAKDDDGTKRAIALAGALTFLSSLLFGCIAVIIHFRQLDQGYLQHILGIVLLIPVGAFVANVSSILIQLSVREGLFRSLGILAGVQALFTVGVQIGLGVLGIENAIIIGSLVGSVLYAALLGKVLWSAAVFTGFRAAQALRRLRETAREFANFPKYAFGADALGLLILSFTPVLISAAFNPALAGVYAFGVRVIRLPLLVVSTAIAGVLRKEGMDYLNRTGNVHALYKNIVVVLLAVGIWPCGVALLFGPEIFAFVFGEQWSEAGRVIQILSPGILLEFVAFPLSTFYLITDNQRIALKLQLSSAVLLGSAIVFGSVILKNFMMTCFLISAVMVVVNLASVALAGRVSKAQRVPAGT